MAIIFDPQNPVDSKSAVRGLAQQQKARTASLEGQVDPANLIELLKGQHQQQQARQQQFEQANTSNIPSLGSIREGLVQQHGQQARPPGARPTFAPHNTNPMMDQMRMANQLKGGGDDYSQQQMPQAMGANTQTDPNQSYLTSALKSNTDSDSTGQIVEPGAMSGPGSMGSMGGSGSSGHDYMRGDPPGPGDLTQIDTAAGPLTVHKNAAEDMKGFVNDMAAAGAPISEIGSYNPRKIAGTDTWSQHAYGTALDWAQSGRNQVTPEFRAWAQANPDVLNSILKNHNMISGGDWSHPDFGHFEWGGPSRGGSMPSAGYTPQSLGNSSTVRGSYFNDTNTASGQSAMTVPGIATPGRQGLGQNFRVTLPDGRTTILPKTDVGPADWTHRGVDLTLAAVRKLYPGMNPKQFPTDAQFKVEPIGN